MALTKLLNKPLKFIMFGGKGGVGKTTMAAATALELAKENKVLIFTTDPAPSLADSFGQAIGSEPTAVAGANNLFAMEIDAKKVLEEFKQEYGKEILDILQQGTYLADKETEEIFNLDIPGLDEVMSLKKITDFMESSDYQLYIVDTAPTGHTLRLLMLPELFDNWIKFLASLRWKYHAMVRQFGKEKQIEKADEFLLDMKRTVKKVRALLQNSEKTEFVVVTIAERMGVSETEDLIRSLEQMRIPTKHIIINNIFPRAVGSPRGGAGSPRGGAGIACGDARPEESDGIPVGTRLDTDFARIRRENQQKYIHEIKQKFSPRIITEIVLQPTEIQGLDSLQKLGAQLF